MEVDRQPCDVERIVEDVRRTAELIIDEFIKVQTLKARAKEVLKTAQAEHGKLLTDVRTEYFQRIEEYLAAMTALRTHRGHLITLKETRYVDLETLAALETEAVERFDKVSRDAIAFLEGDEAFAPLRTSLSRRTLFGGRAPLGDEIGVRASLGANQ